MSQRVQKPGVGNSYFGGAVHRAPASASRAAVTSRVLGVLLALACSSAGALALPVAAAAGRASSRALAPSRTADAAATRRRKPSCVRESHTRTTRRAKGRRGAVRVCLEPGNKTASTAIPQLGGGYPNSRIADVGLSHVGTYGGQCKQAVNNWVAAASNGAQHLGGGYYSDYAKQGGALIGRDQTLKGDIIQINGPSVDAYYNGMHSAVIVSHAAGSNSFEVVDSNWGWDQTIRHHVINPYSLAGAHGLTVHFWRMGDPDTAPVIDYPPFQATFAAQFPANGEVDAQAGQQVGFGFNLGFNMPFDAQRFILRPTAGDPTTNANLFVRFGAPPRTGDFPGAVAPDNRAGGYYRANMVVPATTAPGRYFIQWHVIDTATGQDGGVLPAMVLVVKNAGELGTYPPPNPNAPKYAAEFVSQSYQHLLALGASETVQVKVKNVGQVAWGADVNLATPDDSPIKDGTTGVINGNRVHFTDVEGDPFVSPGEIATFTYTVQGPSDKATAFRQHLGMVREGVGHFAINAPGTSTATDVFVPVVVADSQHWPSELTAADCTWAFVAQGTHGTSTPNGSAVVTSSQANDFFFTLRNTSDLCPWFETGTAPFHLGTVRPNDRFSGFYDSSTWLSANRIGLPSGTGAIAPGSTGTFQFGLKESGLNPGAYSEYFAPIIEGFAHLTDVGMFVPIQVQ